jgi:hypothetical protein
MFRNKDDEMWQGRILLSNRATSDRHMSVTPIPDGNETPEMLR